MKFILNIGVALSLLASVFVSCTDDEVTPSGIDVNVNNIEIAPIGGTQSVNVSSSEDWIVTSSEPWIYVSPTNGSASTKCKISIDSTHLAEVREGKVVFRTAGIEREITISQAGFPKQVTVNEAAVVLPSYLTPEEQYFEIEVTTNVPFEIAFTGEDASTWLSYEKFDLGLNANYRPRTTKIRFNWEVNTRTYEKLSDIIFVPIQEEDVDAETDLVGVKQESAEEIIPSRKGDSLAILAINRGLQLFASDVAQGSDMLHWPSVKLWTVMDIKRAIEEENERENPDMDRIEAIRGFKGRVRVVDFFFFGTEKAIPYEVRYLDAAEEILFRSNEDHQQLNLSLGDDITTLKYLKKLTVFAYGINSLSESVINLSRLQYLDLSQNVFDESPVDLLNETNFPDLKHLNMLNCRRVDAVDDLGNPPVDNIGLRGELPIEWLTWENLETLMLANNYYEGVIPTMEDVVGVEKYTAEDEVTKENPALIGTPKVLPNCEKLMINLNRLGGELPVWILEHPNLDIWIPDVMIYNQDAGLDSNGNQSGFTNVPL